MAAFIVGLLIFIFLGSIAFFTFMAHKELDDAQARRRKAMEDLKKASDGYFQILRNFNASMGDLHL